MFGRNNESPLPVIAPSSPGDCFARAIEACQIAIRHMTPVVLLSDGYLANGSEPWRLPETADLEDFGVEFHTRTENFLPYLRDAADAGAAVGDPRDTPGSSTASAASRNRTAPATSPTTRRTTSTWCGRAPRRSPASPT
jgi:pyruvate/2-oxoacid:ferredoxin oxidoreductase alpha subunit